MVGNSARGWAWMLLALVSASKFAWCDSTPLRERFRAELTVHGPVNFVAGRIGNEIAYCVQGDVVREGKRIAAVDVVDAHGKLLRTITEPGPTGTSQAGAYLHCIDYKRGPMVLFSWVPDKDGVPGGADLVRVRDGEVVARIANTTRFGNNNSIIADIDGDGKTDALYADQQSLSLCSVPELAQRWRIDTGINFCWSLPALVDVTGDGR